MSMKKVIRKTGGRILYMCRCIRWFVFYQSTKFKPRKTNYIQDDSWYNQKKMLLIVPHADDELLSSYTLLRRCSDITIYYCGFLGTNQNEENRNIRLKEIMKLCNELSVPVIEGHGTCENLKEIIVGYDTIVIPSIIDWHYEHRKVSYLLYDILKDEKYKPEIYSYSVTVPNESESSVLANCLTKKEHEEKYSLFYAFYKSQKFMPIYRFRMNERINGHHVGVYAAEVFSKFQTAKWLSFTLRIKEAEEKHEATLMKLIDSIGNTSDLKGVRNVSKEFYSYFEKEIDTDNGNFF